MGKPEMEKLRRHLHLVHDDQLRVVFDGSVRPEEGMVGGLRVECIPCDDVLAWDAQSGWYRCNSCGYEVLSEEMTAFLEQVQDKIQARIADLKKPTALVPVAEKPTGSGRKWFWARWLGR